MTGEGYTTDTWRPPVFTSPHGGPFITREEIVMPGDRTRWVAIDPSTGITPGANEFQEQAESDRLALNAAYWLGAAHESHIAGAVVAAARRYCAEPPSIEARTLLFEAMKHYDGRDE